jgi:serine/threonine-protein kinase
MRFHWLNSLLVFGVLGVAHVPRAHAQTTAEKATAELLFEEALTLMRNGSFAEACPKLESSQRTDPAVGTLLYLSECYEKQGRTASAWVTFREAAALAQSEGQLERAKVAAQRADQLQKELALLTIDIALEAREIAGLQVRCGPVPVDISLGTITVPVDPGQVTVEASAPGYLPFSRQVTLDAKGRGSLTIPALTSDGSVPAAASNPVAAGTAPAAPADAQMQSSPAAPLPAADSESSSVPVAPIVLGSVGLVGLGVGAYFGATAMSDADEAKDLCPDGNCTSQRGEDLMDDARTAATVSNIAFGVGIASLATGLVLYFVGSGDTKEAADSGLVPLAVDRGAGFAWRGSL